MTLLRWSLLCAVLALYSHSAHVDPQGQSHASLAFYLFITASVVLGSLGAFVFRKY